MTTILLLVLFGMAAGCSKAPEEKSQHRSAEVTVITLETKDVPVSGEYVAQTQSSRLVNIQARVTGFLDRRVYTEGAMVKEGDTLFLMDRKPFQAQLDQAQAAMARQVAAMDTAKANLARVKPLAEMDALSQKDLDDAKGQYESYAAAVDQAKAQVETAKLNLSYTIITSPVTGITSFAQQTEGTYISTQNSLLTTVAVLSPMWVNFSLSENEIQSFREQEKRGLMRTPKDKNYVVEIILVDGSLYPYTGRITFADSSFNAQTGTFLVRASVDNPKGILMPNQYVRVRVKGAIRPNAILVPQRAIQQSSKGHIVWVVKEGKAEARPVTVGNWDGNEWFVFEGLRAGEQVVVDGSLLLSPGMPVTVKPFTKPAEGPTPAVDSKKNPVKAGGKQD
ncbi:efflux RND transporter periplasmic adaptor subunit [bacterium]|nr:efflux RND transporter periplasmic adaptor subunit [bacterium]